MFTGAMYVKLYTADGLVVYHHQLETGIFMEIFMETKRDLIYVLKYRDKLLLIQFKHPNKK